MAQNVTLYNLLISCPGDIKEEVALIESAVEEFNEFLFDYTSKISLEDIKKANKPSKQVKKIKSPYTLERKQRKSIPPFIIYGVIAIVVCIIIYYVILLITDKEDTKGNDIIMINEEMNYELT